VAVRVTGYGDSTGGQRSVRGPSGEGACGPCQHSLMEIYGHLLLACGEGHLPELAGLFISHAQRELCCKGERMCNWFDSSLRHQTGAIYPKSDTARARTPGGRSSRPPRPRPRRRLRSGRQP
jgi:hypothetical protein